MTRLQNCALALVLTVFYCDQGFAAPSPIGLGDFGGSETVIDFNSISNEELINTQFVGQGVQFGGALYGMTNSGDTVLFPGNGGGVIASNWLYSLGIHQGTSFTATFDSLQHRVGFYAETNFSDDTTITVELGGSDQGSVTFDTVLLASFVGVEDLSGFNSITVSVSGLDNNFLAIDDFRFESIVPEPSAALLMCLGVAGSVWCRRRGSRS